MSRVKRIGLREASGSGKLPHVEKGRFFNAKEEGFPMVVRLLFLQHSVKTRSEDARYIISSLKLSKAITSPFPHPTFAGVERVFHLGDSSPFWSRFCLILQQPLLHLT